MEYSGFQRSRSLPRAWFRWKWCPRASKPGTETLDCASSPIHYYPSHPPSATTRSRQLPTILRSPPPPPFVAFLHFQLLPPPRYYIAGKSLSTCRGVQVSLSLSLSPSLSLPVLETKFKLDTANNGAPMGKYDSSNFVFPLP